MQRRSRVITLQGAIKKNERFDGNIIISYFGSRNNNFADYFDKICLKNWKKKSKE